MMREARLERIRMFQKRSSLEKLGRMKGDDLTMRQKEAFHTDRTQTSAFPSPTHGSSSLCLIRHIFSHYTTYNQPHNSQYHHYYYYCLYLCLSCFCSCLLTRL